MRERMERTEAMLTRFCCPNERARGGSSLNSSMLTVLSAHWTSFSISSCVWPRLWGPKESSFSTVVSKIICPGSWKT